MLTRLLAESIPNAAADALRVPYISLRFMWRAYMRDSEKVGDKAIAAALKCFTFAVEASHASALGTFGTLTGSFVWCRPNPCGLRTQATTAFFAVPPAPSTSSAWPTGTGSPWQEIFSTCTTTSSLSSRSGRSTKMSGESAVSSL